MDPVSNIIYNTIWYHANFPAAVTPVLVVIGPDSLTRLESRSFYGLVSFIQTRYHHLSEHQAVQCLIAACGQLSLADPKLMSTAEQAKVRNSIINNAAQTVIISVTACATTMMKSSEMWSSKAHVLASKRLTWLQPSQHGIPTQTSKLRSLLLGREIRWL
jgi:hypothetical protein